MRKCTIFTVILSISLAACAPIIPESGADAATTAPVEFTPVISTMVAETVAPLPTSGVSPTLAPPTPI
ncbi:MAG TPA: hypothetical protein VLS45_10670, partial [Methylomicrobium sp.]|nr:hypothetical protein [Methylomicrobium sp.]